MLLQRAIPVLVARHLVHSRLITNHDGPWPALDSQPCPLDSDGGAVGRREGPCPSRCRPYDLFLSTGLEPSLSSIACPRALAPSPHPGSCEGNTSWMAVTTLAAPRIVVTAPAPPLRLCAWEELLSLSPSNRHHPCAGHIHGSHNGTHSPIITLLSSQPTVEPTPNLHAYTVFSPRTYIHNHYRSRPPISSSSSSRILRL